MMTAQGKFPPQPFRRQGDWATALYRACLTVGQRARAPGRPDRWTDDLIDTIIRAPQSPSSMANPDTADLVTVVAEFVAALQPMSAAAGLFALATNLSFGRAGELFVPAIGDLPMADFIAEGAPMPVIMGLTSGVSMSPYKIGAIVAMTNEMMRSSSAEQLMEAALTANIGPSLDRLVFSNTAAAPGLRPPGILNGVPPITPPSALTNSEGMIQDMMTLAKAVAPYGGQIAFIASADCWVRMTKADVGAKGAPVFVASNLDTPTLIAIVAPALAVAIDAPMIDTSSQAVMHMDDAPLPIVDNAGVMASPVRSMWQTDSVGLRFRLPVSWVLRAPEAVAWLAPNWGSPPGP